MQVGLGGLRLIKFWGKVTCNSPCMQGSQLYISSLAVLNKIFAQYHGFTNGLSKALSWRLVDIVTSTGLCDKHRLQSSLQSNPGQFPVLLLMLVV